MYIFLSQEVAVAAMPLADEPAMRVWEGASRHLFIPPKGLGPWAVERGALTSLGGSAVAVRLAVVVCHLITTQGSCVSIMRTVC